MKKSEYACWAILPKVSRSFALAIKLLPKPLDMHLNIAYLIYRLLDTVEDSSLNFKNKKILLNKIISLLKYKNYPSKKIKELKKVLFNLEYSYESVLVENINLIYKIFYSQPTKIKKAIIKWGVVMKNGMLKFQKKKIKTMRDQTIYSFYVAGVVGNLFNELLYYNKIISKKTMIKISKYAKGFGIALQKFNILRDIAQDAQENRFFLPISLLRKYGLNFQSFFDISNRQRALQVIAENLSNTRKYMLDGIKYIQLLPKNQLKIRLFCLLSLFMAMESYAKLIGNSALFDFENKIKLTRKQVYKIALYAAIFGHSNKFIQKWFFNLLSRLDFCLASQSFSKKQSF